MKLLKKFTSQGNNTVILISREKWELVEEIFGKINHLYLIGDNGKLIKFNGTENYVQKLSSFHDEWKDMIKKDIPVISLEEDENLKIKDEESR